jgi:predicted outer membrane repeat protein
VQLLPLHDNTTVTISHSWFEDNKADYGGAIFADNYSIINLTDNVSFVNNSASIGGVLYSNRGVITTINASTFYNNMATLGFGFGVLLSFTSTLTIEASVFHDNFATQGLIILSNSLITIKASEFHDNIAREGSLLSSSRSNMIIEGSVFYSNVNRATNGQGVLSSTQYSNITVGDCNFTNNSSPQGAVIFADIGNTIQYHSHILIDKNFGSAAVYLSSSELRGNDSGKLTFSNNSGSLVAVNSNITFSGYIKFVNNQPSKSTTGTTQGGAITLFQSNVFIDGECNLEHNHAENGGAIHSTESKLYVNGDVTIAHNTATGNGGGVYLESTSELNCQQGSTFVLYNNTAVSKGGGLHAISSSIKASFNLDYHSLLDYDYSGTRIHFTKNKAKFGGGLALEANAKLNILKYDLYYDIVSSDTNTTLFTGNSADYGGAVYVDDDTNSGTCASDPRTECFFQVLALYSNYGSGLTLQCMYFSNNSANISGSTLYGGLLDRCAVNQFAEIRHKYPPVYIDKNRGGGITYFKNVSTTYGNFYGNLPHALHS